MHDAERTQAEDEAREGLRALARLPPGTSVAPRDTSTKTWMPRDYANSATTRDAIRELPTTHCARRTLCYTILGVVQKLQHNIPVSILENHRGGTAARCARKWGCFTCPKQHVETLGKAHQTLTPDSRFNCTTDA